MKFRHFTLAAVFCFIISSGAKAEAADAKNPYIQSGSLLVVVSPNNDYVAVFSTQTGLWKKQKIAVKPKTKIRPIVGRDIVVFQAGDRVYGFSHKTGWASVKVPAEKPVVPTLTFHLAAFHVGGRVYAFSSLQGKWGSAMLTDGDEIKLVVTGNMVIVHDDGKLYAFGDKSGKWAVLDINAK